MDVSAGFPEPFITRIAQIAITARDLARATRFYRDVLGLPLLFEAPGLAFFDCGGIRLMLGAPESPEFDHPSSIVYFSVGDIRTAFARVIERGAASEREPHLIARLPDREVWMAFFRDSEHNVLALMSEMPLGAGGSANA